MHRLFVALQLPDEIRARLAFIQTGLAAARWVPPENFHISLAFIGNVGIPALEDAHSALDAIRAERFDLTLTGIDFFGDRRPRSVWAAVSRTPGLIALQEKVETALRRAGFPQESRRYTPHVTLARLKITPADRVARFIERFGLFSAGPFTVDAFHLYESRLGGGASVYEPIADYDLR